MKLSQVAAITRGRLEGSGDTVVTGVGIDSRAVRRGDMFVALEGEFLDGHDFIASARSAGSSAALVSRKVEGIDQVIVDDQIDALWKLASFHRDTIDPLVIGITGSTGKTSTKQLIAEVAATRFQTVASERSFNNELGLPLTLLSALTETEVVVCEMGARAPGHIAQLCAIARPHVGVITNIGVTHYEQFGSQEAIAQTKSELISSLPDGGTAILWLEDEWYPFLAERTEASIFTFGSGPPASVWVSDVTTDRIGRARGRLHTQDTSIWLELLMSGIHQMRNAAAAAATGLALGISLEESRPALQRAKGSDWRMQVSEVNGVLIVNDAYNANPTSVSAALETCAEMVRGRGRLVAVLGYMAELGEIEEQEHRRVGASAAAVAHRLVVVGEAARPIAEAAAAAGMAEVELVMSLEEVPRAIGDVSAGDLVLVKGSRSVRLERAVDLIEEVITR